MWHCLRLPFQSTQWVDQICSLQHQNSSWNTWDKIFECGTAQPTWFWVFHYALVHRYLRISFSSSIVNSFRPNWLFLISIISMIKLIFHTSSIAISWKLFYIMLRYVFNGTFFSRKRIFLSFEPEMDLTSLFTYFLHISGLTKGIIIYHLYIVWFLPSSSTSWAEFSLISSFSSHPTRQE